MNARKGNITVEPYTRSVRTVQREGRKSLNFPSTLFFSQPEVVTSLVAILPLPLTSLRGFSFPFFYIFNGIRR